MKVLLFAQCRQICDCHEYLLKTESALSQAEFWRQMVAAFPGLAALQKASRLARNEAYLQDDDQLQSDDEIAVIPPVSGG